MKMISPIEELKESREDLVSRISEGKISDTFQENYTEIMDRYFQNSLQVSKTGHSLFKEKTPFALVAVGGYGRMELCVHSDIDILILFGSKIAPKAKKLTEEIFYPLWDIGLDLGHGIRSVKDCMRLSKDDYEVLTSMMDARFICGDSPLYLALMDSIYKKVVSKKAIALGKWLEDRDRIRMKIFGDASYLLEPNLKEGIGGLRDYHHILWLCRSLFHLRSPEDLEHMGKLSRDEYRDLKKHLQFIWLVRNHLHQISGRENDRLGFEYQEKIARRLGFKDQKDIPGVEQFLGRLHASMASIKILHRSFTLTYLPQEKGKKKAFKTGNISEIDFDSATAIPSNPSLLMEIFEQSSISGRPLSMNAKRLVREFLYLVDDTFRKSEEVVQNFLNIMNSKNTIETLDQMFETGFLDAFIPEFGQIRDRVQFDAYHIFPVGRHTLETVKYLKRLTTQKDILLTEIFLDLSSHEPLFLAALFHDVGKSGKDHARKGAAITQNILKRFGYDKKGTGDILFLVRHHLLLVETATRRDLNDEKVVVQCARTIGDIERLKMLYLLTWADSRATGPKAWNDWISNLVRELFFKAIHILEKKELATPHVSQRLKKTKSEVGRLITNDMDLSDLEDFFKVMSPRYLLNTGAHDIVNHISMVHDFKKQLENPRSTSFILEAKKDESEGCWGITFLARDRPGLFSDLAGVLALNNINVLSAQIYTWRDGTAVDIFKVTNPLDPINPEESWEKVKKDLRHTFSGKLSLAYRLGKKAETSILSSAKRPSRPPKVIVDNETSDFFTLIEVFADNHAGLLYLITRAMFDLRLNIRIAKIATKGDQIADVFYVRDLEGQKVEDKEHVMEIKRALIHQLGT